MNQNTNKKAQLLLDIRNAILKAHVANIPYKEIEVEIFKAIVDSKEYPNATEQT